MSTQYIVQPIAFLFELDTEGVLIPGRGTRESCLNAIRIAKKLQNEGRDVTVLLSVNAHPGFPGNQLSGRAMQRFIELHAPEIRSVYHQSASHNTEGELWAAAEYILGLNSHDVVLINVIKWWHAPRMWQYRLEIFRQMRIWGWCHRKTSTYWLTMTMPEFIHEILGIGYRVIAPITINRNPASSR